MREDLTHWIALSRTDGVGPKLLRALIDRFGSPEDALAAPEAELLQVKRLGPTLAERIASAPKSLEAIETELAMLRENEVEVLTWADEGYPRNLLSVDDAPPVLYVRGNVGAADEFSVAIVGSRECSEAGYELAQDLSAVLAECGVTVVSGFAQGIDSAAHQGALRGRGRTLAVLGSGIGVVPAGQRELAEGVASHGALLSELQPMTPPSGPTLMARDRILSALSRGVIVIEATTDSGTMDTVDRARKQGRLLWAIDWPEWEERHSGNRALRKGGAERLSPEVVLDEVDQVVAALQAFELPTAEEPGPQQRSLFG
ncbi:MAG: DNA-protecting protein DprA [Armatimonadetes bacterium CG_4_10_14_3_um_filter_66_18]|nr:DNA-protecting protein DprA [Armatimonadota bacterium]OIP10476.1 MAG: hypothetical protein AUJ96_03795 [Armatimonadetes bacterium CG2_30_66_41]PIU94890.1 MAG: DNA-protecting protein DprA [Armatimonadetes bacterium CG06_land_8_20_14_3_00_66_21]PIX46230.1 MAG: DNA-protecting protein DprA [Armatimonadetes bacterium CG_4_8_14_3_um_filter_66_20]PIY42165.1 MAG: DNA-protecting protein DprA [Armatimonadetes bacterium CG_4_10_14_3_um_filter_66_18]PIZ50876.1 MAG: DNA-protecting protein DprA [Armatimo